MVINIFVRNLDPTTTKTQIEGDFRALRVGGNRDDRAGP